MSDSITPPNPEETASLEAVSEAVDSLASAFHEDWRKTRLQEDGSFEPREKPTADQSWIEVNGRDTVDIANTSYKDLPEDWQAENKAAAEVVVGIMVEHNGDIDLSDETTRSQVGSRVHEAWLSRNSWAKGGQLDKPFSDLPSEERAKDIAQMEVAQRLFK